MAPTTPKLDFKHLPGFEVPTKYKKVIRQFYGFAKIPVEKLIARYKLPKSTIFKIVAYDKPECFRRKRGSANVLPDSKIDEIIEYLLGSWDTRVLDWVYLQDELNLACSPQILATCCK